MRLIDADKIEWEFKCISKEEIDEMPTVKAIPIEWIRNKIAVNMYLWEEGRDKMFIEEGVTKIVSYSLTAQALSELLDWWEKENAGILQRD